MHAHTHTIIHIVMLFSFNTDINSLNITHIIYLDIYIYMYISFNMFGDRSHCGTCKYKGTRYTLTDVIYKSLYDLS